jgi:glycosyltransferase involved in cell wall biosynthesis
MTTPDSDSSPAPRTARNGEPAVNGHGKESPLRICVMAACPFPANHGTPGSIREMAEAVSERGHEVHIVTYHFGEKIPVQGPYLHRITPLTRDQTVVVGPTKQRPLYDLQMVFKGLEVIRRHRPHLIHAHGYEAALAGWLCRLATGLPLVYSGHNTMSDELPSYHFLPRPVAVALGRILDAFVPRLGNRCIPHSEGINRFLQSMGLQGRTEPIVNFGINLEHMTQGDGTLVRERYGLGKDPVVVYSGVLDEFQRMDLLLEAIAYLAARESKAKLLIVVTIPQAQHLARIRAQAEQLGIADRVVLTDPQPLDAVRDCLMAGDVAVVPRPHAPGFPIKLLNYLATKRPCVMFASSASGLINREHALLVSPDTSEALGEALLEVLRDQVLRERLSRKGHQFVLARHDRRQVARQLCLAYYRTLEATKRLPRSMERLPVLTEHLPGFENFLLDRTKYLTENNGNSFAHPVSVSF